METPITKKDVLIVDDDRSMLAALKFLLAGSGLEVRLATSGEQALGKVSEKPPDLIILDITMRGMDGIEFCRLLSLHSWSRNIPIIFLTARDKMGYIEQAFELGAKEYLVKPVDHRQLLEIVRKYLPRP